MMYREAYQETDNLFSTKDFFLVVLSPPRSPMATNARSLPDHGVGSHASTDAGIPRAGGIP